jgi:hypothetical protein
MTVGRKSGAGGQTFVRGNARHLLGHGKGKRIPLLGKGQFPRG